MSVWGGGLLVERNMIKEDCENLFQEMLSNTMSPFLTLTEEVVPCPESMGKDS